MRRGWGGGKETRGGRGDGKGGRGGGNSGGRRNVKRRWTGQEEMRDVDRGRGRSGTGG